MFGITRTPLDLAGQVALFSPSDLSSLWGWWDYSYEGSLFTERSSPATPTADGGVVGTWRTRSSPARSLTPTADNRRPIYNASRGIQFFERTDGGITNAELLLTGLSAFDRNNFGGGMVLDVHGCGYTCALDFGSGSNLAFNFGSNASPLHYLRFFNGAAFVSTNKYFSSRRCTLSWQSNGTALKIWVNGDLYTGSALSSLTLNQIVVGRFAGGIPQPVTVKQLVVCSSAPSDNDMTKLNSWLRTQAGTLGNGNLVANVGDSLSIGSGSESGRPWWDRVTNRISSEWRSYAYGGAFLFTIPPITAANLVTAGAGYSEKVAILWIGTNDINSGTRTAAQLWSDYDTYRATLQASGWKVIGCTLQAMASNDAQAQAFNTSLLGSSNYNAIANLRSVLADKTNTTYYTSDQVHLKDAGYAQAAAIIEAALATV